MNVIILWHSTELFSVKAYFIWMQEHKQPKQTIWSMLLCRILSILSRLFDALFRLFISTNNAINDNSFKLPEEMIICAEPHTLRISRYGRHVSKAIYCCNWVFCSKHDVFDPFCSVSSTAIWRGLCICWFWSLSFEAARVRLPHNITFFFSLLLN